jgi:hypothetical protein
MVFSSVLVVVLLLLLLSFLPHDYPLPLRSIAPIAGHVLAAAARD